MIGTLTELEIEAFLESNLVGRIGCSSKNKTYVVPISYAYDDGNVYALTQEGLKLDMMRQNASVCFEVDDMRDVGNWKSVIAWGIFKELVDDSEKQQAMKSLSQRVLPYVCSSTMQLGDNWPFTNHDFNPVSGVLFKIALTEKSGRFERSEQLKAYGE
jgi:uncharacterized protein